MSTPIRLRTADRLKDSDFAASGFTVRKNKPVRILESIFVGLALGLVCVVIVLYYNVLTGFYILLGAAIVITLVNIQLERMKLMLRSTEFMNAILSSSLGEGFRFCMVIRNDGDIIYLNRGFQKMFPKFITQPNLTIGMWASTQEISSSDLEKINQSISSGSTNRLSIGMRTGDAHYQETVNVQIAQVPHPKGYALIRGE